MALASNWEFTMSSLKVQTHTTSDSFCVSLRSSFLREHVDEPKQTVKPDET